MSGNRPSPSWICSAVFLTCAAPGAAQDQEAVFHSDTNLQSIGVQVTDRQKRDMRGLTASDFTILEDGRPQKIAFFGTEEDPITLAILLDTSPSMESGQKLARARALLAPLIRGNLPEDEIFLVPFTDRIGTFQRLSADQRVNPPAVRRDSFTGGTSLHDALATALCHLRTAKNSRQAMVVITDGADQLSRLHLEGLIRLAQSSRPQIFMIGFFDANEAGLFRSSGKTVSLVSAHEIDNPIQVFARIAKESGAESFFPSSESDLKKALDRILGILRAQFTLAYYPLGYSAKDAGKVRRIQVRVNRADAVVAAQRAVGSESSAEDSVHFEGSGCFVSPLDHPYPWEARVTGWNPHSTASLQNIRYHETFTDPQSGWPNRDGSRYRNGAYEISHGLGRPAPLRYAEGTLAAYGPWWEDFRASITVAAARANGIVFRLNSSGYYGFLVTSAGPKLSFKLIKRNWSQPTDREIVPWTLVDDMTSKFIEAHRSRAGGNVRISVETKGAQLTMLVNDVPVAQVQDDTFADGYVGMALFGAGTTLFRDLAVEGSAVSFGSQ